MLAQNSSLHSGLMPSINFLGDSRDVYIETGRYPNDRLAVQLIEGGDDFATVSVNLPDEAIGLNEFAFKTYSENEGLFEELLRVNVIELTGRVTRSMLLPICRLTETKREPHDE
jgi:hypothetical protein